MGEILAVALASQLVVEWDVQGFNVIGSLYFNSFIYLQWKEKPNVMLNHLFMIENDMCDLDHFWLSPRLNIWQNRNGENSKTTNFANFAHHHHLHH